ncbi:MAG: hypothetical protein ACREQM_06395, partial [Candidatus Dormibacteraceae bacterium]
VRGGRPAGLAATATGGEQQREQGRRGDARKTHAETGHYRASLQSAACFCFGAAPVTRIAGDPMCYT